MSCPSLAPSPSVFLSLSFFFCVCLCTRHRTVPDGALPLVRLLVQFCNFLTVADCRAMLCQRVEVASYGMPFRKNSSERRHETCLWGAMYSGSFAVCELLQFRNNSGKKKLWKLKNALYVQVFYKFFLLGHKKVLNNKLWRISFFRNTWTEKAAYIYLKVEEKVYFNNPFRGNSVIHTLNVCVYLGKRWWDRDRNKSTMLLFNPWSLKNSAVKYN